MNNNNNNNKYILNNLSKLLINNYDFLNKKGGEGDENDSPVQPAQVNEPIKPTARQLMLNKNKEKSIMNECLLKKINHKNNKLDEINKKKKKINNCKNQINKISRQIKNQEYINNQFTNKLDNITKQNELLKQVVSSDEDGNIDTRINTIKVEITNNRRNIREKQEAFKQVKVEFKVVYSSINSIRKSFSNLSSLKKMLTEKDLDIKQSLIPIEDNKNNLNVYWASHKKYIMYILNEYNINIIYSKLKLKYNSIGGVVNNVSEVCQLSEQINEINSLKALLKEKINNGLGLQENIKAALKETETLKIEKGKKYKEIKYQNINRSYNDLNLDIQNNIDALQGIITRLKEFINIHNNNTKELLELLRTKDVQYLSLLSSDKNNFISVT